MIENLLGVNNSIAPLPISSATAEQAGIGQNVGTKDTFKPDADALKAYEAKLNDYSNKYNEWMSDFAGFGADLRPQDWASVSRYGTDVQTLNNYINTILGI
jgi:hypothetical protein